MHPRLLLVLLVFLGETATVFSQPIVYVKFDAVGRNDGSSWQNAYTNLGMAIAKTASGQIWVARGIYLPSLDSAYRSPDNRQDATFHLHDGLQLFGGFSGLENALVQREFQRYATVLSGDFEQNDVQRYQARQLWTHPSRQDNAYHVVEITTGKISIDGFTISGGNTHPIDSSDWGVDKFPSSRGGGLRIYLSGKNCQCEVEVKNCRFISNAAWWSAGGLLAVAKDQAIIHLVVYNCLFMDCQSVFAGAINLRGILRGSLFNEVENCTFYQNSALISGAALSMAIEEQHRPATNQTIVRNSIFWNNNANGDGDDLDNFASSTYVEHCNLENNFGVGNISVYPVFVRSIAADTGYTAVDEMSILKFCPRNSSDACLTPVVFNGFLINNKLIKFSEDLNIIPPIALRPSENTIGISFSLIGFSANPSKAIEYCLEGFDKTWRSAKQQDTVYYENLSGGNYRFRLRTYGADIEKTLSVSIAQYFWQTAWFRLLTVVIVIIGGALAYFLFQNRRLREKKIALEHAQTLLGFRQKTAESEMKALRAQMNPHFIFNSLNSINAYILRNEGTTANAYLTDFAHLMRQLLDNSARETIPLENEIEFLQSYLRAETLRLENKLAWEIQVSDAVDTFETEIPSMILQPYLENAIWHGISPKPEGGRVLVAIRRDGDGALLLTVEDNGIGRERARALRAQRTGAHESKGLKITEERLALYAQKHGTRSSVTTTDLFDGEGNAAGTRVEVRIYPKRD